MWFVAVVFENWVVLDVVWEVYVEKIVWSVVVVVVVVLMMRIVVLIIVGFRCLVIDIILVELVNNCVVCIFWIGVIEL